MICTHCNKPFEQSNHNNVKYCSRLCRERAKAKPSDLPINYNCRECGEDLPRPNKVRKFCNDKCYFTHRNKKRFVGKRKNDIIERREKVDEYYFIKHLTAQEIASLTNVSTCTINKDISILFREKQIGCILEKAN